MDPTQGQSAFEWLEQADEAEIREVLSGYGEERFAKQIAKAIVAARRRGPVRRTGQLAALVAASAGTLNRGRIRRRGRFKLYGFTSIRSLRNCR